MPDRRGHKFAAAAGALLATSFWAAGWLVAAEVPAAPAPTVPAPAAAAVTAPPSPAAAPAPAASAAAAPAAAAPVMHEDQLAIRRENDPAAASSAAKTTAAPEQPSSSTSEVGKVMGALGVVIGLIFALRWGSRKILSLPTGSSSSHLMRVIARTPLAPKQSVLLLRVGQRLMVVGDSGGNLSSLGQITDPDEVAVLLGQAKSTQPTTPTNFGGVLRKLSRRFRSGDDELNETTEPDPAKERAALIGGGDEMDASPSAAVAEAETPQVGLSDAAAQEAVEAARRDVQTLREKLREISQKMGTTSTSESAT